MFTTKIDVEVLDGTRIEDDMMILHARCSDCRVWPNGFLDATSPDQPMIYAFGSPYALQSSSVSADLKRHVRYGRFTMDMTAATGTGGVPLKSNANSGVQELGGMTKDVDRKTLAHAILGCLVLFVVWPLNVLIAGFLKNIRIHVGFSIAIFLCLGVVYGLGISTSNQYNRVSPSKRPSKHHADTKHSPRHSTHPTRSSYSSPSPHYCSSQSSPSRPWPSSTAPSRASTRPSPASRSPSSSSPAASASSSPSNPAQ